MSHCWTTGRKTRADIMMGSMKASKIRAEVRKAFKMTDPELLAWFNQQLEAGRQKRTPNPTEIDTLRLLRDALVKEVKRPKRKRKSRAAAGQSLI